MENYFNTTGISKQKFIMDILADNELVKCLKYPVGNFLSCPDVEPASLLYENIFPTKFVPNVHEDVRSYICMGFQYSKSKSSNFYYCVSEVTFYMFCHKTIVRTEYGMTRPDFMLAHVDSFMHRRRSNEWLGEIEFVGGGDEILDQNGNYVGVYARYKGVGLA